MKKPLRKALLNAAKLVLAVGLLLLIFSKVHWKDYVQTADGKNFAVEQALPSKEAPQTLVVSEGSLWWKKTSATRPASDFVKIPSRDPNTATVLRAGFATAVSQMSLPLLALAVLGFLISVLTTSVRWWLLLRIQDIVISLWEAIRLTFLGQFFNTVMPSTVGGDLIKAYYIAKHTPKKAAVLVSVFVDRVMGLAELTLLAGVMVGVVLLAGLAEFSKVRQPVYMVAAVMAIVIVALAFLLSSRLRQMLHLDKVYQRLPIAHHFAAAGDAARLYRIRLWALVKAVAITVGSQSIWIFSIYLMSCSLQMPIPAYAFFVYVPLIYIIGAVPLTPGGVGVVEGTYIYFLGQYCDASQILALAMLARLVPIFWSLPGVVVYFNGPKLPKAAEMEAELNQ